MKITRKNGWWASHPKRIVVINRWKSYVISRFRLFAGYVLNSYTSGEGVG
jgi:hypothetical protein